MIVDCGERMVRMLLIAQPGLQVLAIHALGRSRTLVPRHSSLLWTVRIDLQPIPRLAGLIRLREPHAGR